MRRKIEYFIIFLTFGFLCFIGGYYSGNKGSVNIVAASKSSDVQMTQSDYAAPGLIGSNPKIPLSQIPDTHDKTDEYNVQNVPVTIQSDNDNDNPDKTNGQNNDDVRAALIDDNQDQAGYIQENQIISPGSLRPGDGKININTASPAELTDLPGIGNVLAGRIVDFRNQNGAFSSIDGIMKVSGIGEKKFAAIRDKITV